MFMFRVLAVCLLLHGRDGRGRARGSCKTSTPVLCARKRIMREQTNEIEKRRICSACETCINILAAAEANLMGGVFETMKTSVAGSGLPVRCKIPRAPSHPAVSAPVITIDQLAPAVRARLPGLPITNRSEEERRGSGRSSAPPRDLTPLWFNVSRSAAHAPAAVRKGGGG